MLPIKIHKKSGFKTTNKTSGVNQVSSIQRPNGKPVLIKRLFQRLFLPGKPISIRLQEFCTCGIVIDAYGNFLFLVLNRCTDFQDKSVQVPNVSHFLSPRFFYRFFQKNRSVCNCIFHDFFHFPSGKCQLDSKRFVV